MWARHPRDRRHTHHSGRQPLAAHFGSGLVSSSEGQFFQAGGFGRDAGTVNAHYGREPGMKFYTHLPDRFELFHTKVISAISQSIAASISTCTAPSTMVTDRNGG